MSKRPHELTLELFTKTNMKRTPEEIDKHVGNGPYAAKHIWFLRKLGYEFNVEKEGRTVKSYTFISEPDNTEEIRAGKPAKAPKSPKAKTVKAKNTKAAVPATKATSKKSAPKKAKKEDKPVMDVAEDERRVTDEDLMSDEPVETSFSVDPDWDSNDIDVRELLG